MQINIMLKQGNSIVNKMLQSTIIFSECHIFLLIIDMSFINEFYNRYIY